MAEQEESPKIRAEDLFTTSIEDPLSYFYTSNQIISEPKVVLQFFKNFNQYQIDQQQKILNTIITALKTVTTNSYTLNMHGQSQAQGKMQIMKIVIDLICQNVKNYLIFNNLLTILQFLLSTSTLEQEIYKQAINKMVSQFYQNKLDLNYVFASVNILKSFYEAKLQAQKQPKNMMVFHGGNGIQLSSKNKENLLNWKFQQGLTLMMWINIQNIKFGTQTKLSKIFTFLCPNKGGIQSYLIDNKVYYRILGPKYTEPQIGSNGILIGQLQPKKWNFICYEHEGSKTFTKSKLNFYVNKNKPSSFSIDPPKIPKDDKVKYIFFDKIYCKNSSVGVFFSPIGLQEIQEYNKNINSIDQQMKKTKAFVFQLRQGYFYERNGFGDSTKYILQRDLSMNFQNVLPLFYLLRFIKQDNNYPLLNELFGIIVLFLRKSSKNQTQIQSQQYLKIVSTLVAQTKNQLFDQNTIKTLLHIKHTITDANLLDQYFSDFLWPLITSSSQMQRKQEITQVIKNAFAQNIGHYHSILGIDQMINYLIKIQSKSITCCQKHYNLVTNKIQSSFSFEESPSKPAERATISYILQLIQLCFQNSTIKFQQECYKICRLFTLKFSPCFMLELLSLLNKVLNQKLSQKISQTSSKKKLLKFFHDKKVYLIFLHVIQNSYFAQIKAQCVKIIYKVFLKKATQSEQEQVSQYISKALWQIKQEKQYQSPIKPRSVEQEQQVEKQIQIQEQQQIVLQLPKTFNKKFGNKIMVQNDANSQFKEVGPVAPKLSNRQKGHKSFNFDSFALPQIKAADKQQMFEQEKTNDPIQQSQVQIQPIESKIKGKKKFGLSLNIQAINQMHTFGGQGGQQIIISKEQEANQLQKIRKLAKICVQAMKKKSKYQEQKEKQQLDKLPSYQMIPPPTTKHKTLAQRKKNIPNLNFIEEQEEDQIQKPISPQSQQIDRTINKIKTKEKLQIKQQKISKVQNIKKPSNISPTSIKSVTQDNLVALYNSLLECCLGLSFQTSLIQNAQIQIPSVLCIFFKWIPSTDLQTKFLNDLQIIMESAQNVQKILQIPELYDFIYELCYKCIVCEVHGQKRIYTEKLQTFIKRIFNLIFLQDPNGLSKFSFLIDWSNSKKQEYHPKSLFFATRYAVLLMLQSIQEYLVMNKNNDKIMERNFQFFGIFLQTLKKFIPAACQDFKLQNSQTVMIQKQCQIPTSLYPYFKSRWSDFSLCQKYYFLFKKFFCTQWYNKNFKKCKNNQTSFMDIGFALLSKQSSYYLRDNFLISIIQITKSLFLHQSKDTVQYNNYSIEIIWQIVALVILSESDKQKKNKHHKSQMILCFLKNCKVMADLQIQKITEIIPILSGIKHSIAILQMNSTQLNKSNTGQNGILDEIIQNYIPQYLLNMDKGNDMQSFKLHFAQVWIPSENQYKKLHSELFLAYKEKINKLQDSSINTIDLISSIIQQQNERSYFVSLLLQADRRKTKNKFRKIWENLRIYSQIWRIPNFSWQIDTLFNKTIYSFDKYQGNLYHKYKISKHQSKAKARYFLKPRLFQPEIAINYECHDQQNVFERNDLYLQKAIMYFTQKLSIGKTRLSWLCEKQNQLQIVFAFKKMRIINTLTIRSGQLAIINDKLIFVAAFVKQKYSHLAIDQYQTKHDKSVFKVWPLEYIKEVVRKRYVNRRKAVQINFIQGKSLLFEFLENSDLQDFFKKITKIKGTKCPNLSLISKSDSKKLFQNYGYLAKWSNFQISNFQYLMELNYISGRSYSDTTQYPVMPWVLTNFSSPKLTLSQQSNFRNLTLPMGALGSEQRTHTFQQRYNMMQVQDTQGNMRRFHYGTHYSSPGIIYHFLVRLSPFTQGSILLQNGKFDFADRLFFSMGDSFKNATSQYSDVRQLIPELYTIPQAYLNINHLDLGVMQNKKRVNNVQLPQWARQNPYLYVTKLRKAFQDSNVSYTLNYWIDLIFGYKQTGQQSINNLNCYFHLTYEDSVDWDKIQDQKQVKAIQSQILNFGQTPSQIFAKPHPEKMNLSSIKNYNMICDSQAQIKVYRPLKNRNLLQDQLEMNPMRHSPQSIVHMKWVKDDRLVFIRRSGQMLFYKWHPPSNINNNKIPFQCAIEKQKKVQKIMKLESETHYFYDPSLNLLSFPMQFINKGMTICLGGVIDGKLLIVDVQSNSIVDCYNFHQHTISCIKADTKDNFLITGDIKGNVIAWRLVSSHNSYKLAVYEVFHDQKGQITSIFFSYQLKCFAVSSMDGSVILYNIITGKKMRAYYHPKRLPINQVIISTNPLACVVLFSNQQSLIYCYSLNGQLIQRVHEKDNEYFFTPILMKDSFGFEYVSYGNEHGQTIIRALPYLDSPKKLNVTKNAIVNRVCISRNGKYMVTGCSDGELSVITDPNFLNK